jgi:hypothetical protein
MRGYQDEDGSFAVLRRSGPPLLQDGFQPRRRPDRDGQEVLHRRTDAAPAAVRGLPAGRRRSDGHRPGAHARRLPARKLLEQEGMHYEGYVDIFDAGPVLQGRVSELRALRDSVLHVADEGRPRRRDRSHCWCRTRSSTISAWCWRNACNRRSAARSALSVRRNWQLLHVPGGRAEVRTLSLNVRKNVPMAKPVQLHQRRMAGRFQWRPNWSPPIDPSTGRQTWSQQGIDRGRRRRRRRMPRATLSRTGPCVRWKSASPSHQRFRDLLKEHNEELAPSSPRKSASRCGKRAPK